MFAPRQIRSCAQLLRLMGMTAFLCAVVWLHPGRVQAASAKIVDLNVTQQTTDFHVQAKCEGAFTKHVNNAMLSGIPIELNIRILVTHRRSGLDRTIHEEKFTHIVENNNITNQYTMQLRRGKKDVTFIETRFSKVRDEMSRIDTILTIPPEKFPTKGQYDFAVKVTLNPQKIPLAVEFLTFFLKNPIDTPWKSLLFEPVFQQIDRIDGGP